MTGLNKVQIIGNLGRDPEMRYTPQGSAVTSFSVAVGRKWNNRDGSQGEETIWFRVEAWERLAEICNQYLTKGQQVFVEGRLKPPRVYTDRNGVSRCDPEISASTMLMLSGRGDSIAERGESYGEPDYVVDDEPRNAPQRSGGGGGGGGSSSSSERNKPRQIENDDMEDEIPF